MPRDERLRAHCERVWARCLKEEGLELIGWRSVPVENGCLSDMVRDVEPVHRHVFVRRPASMTDQEEFERHLYIVRKIVSNAIHDAYKGRDIGHYTVSLSTRTLVYKGMFLSYPGEGLLQGSLRSAPDVGTGARPPALLDQHLPILEARASLPDGRAQRRDQHAARQRQLDGGARRRPYLRRCSAIDISKLWPISYEGQSDTACFDNALEFLTMGGYSLAHAAMMLIPEAWAGNPTMDTKRRAFYEYHACLMEPWDGPAAMAFTDGRQIGATLDRNGLRPARYLVTKDDTVIMSSESGVLPVAEENIVKKWRLQPGKMLLIDLEKGRIISDEELKAEIAASHPYETWLKRTQIKVADLPLPSKANSAAEVECGSARICSRRSATRRKASSSCCRRWRRRAKKPSARWAPTRRFRRCRRSRSCLHTYFKQNFAQVTNPPIDSIREELVMSLVSFIGPRPNILDLQGTSKQKRLEVDQPILTNEDLERIRGIGAVKDNDFASITIDITYPADKGEGGMGPALDGVCAEAEEYVRAKEFNIIILSDRRAGPDRIAIPSLARDLGRASSFDQAGP